MTDEEKKALAEQRGITVEQLERELAGGNAQTQPPDYDAEKQKIVGGASGWKKNVADVTLNAGEGVAAAQNEAAEKTAQAIENQKDEVSRAAMNYEIAAEGATEEMKKANETYRAAVDTANKAEMETNSTILQRYINEAELARKENEVMGKAERSATLWTGATELAAALANLVGVSTGAENQQIKPYSESWMHRAEQNRKDRIGRIDSLRDRRAALEQQIAALKASGAKELAGVDRQNTAYGIGRGEEASKRKYDLGVSLSGLDREAATARAGGKAAADVAKWQSLAAAGGAAYTPRFSGGSSGSSGTPRPAGIPKNAYPLSLGGTAYWVDDRSVIRNVQAHKGKFDTVTQNAVNNIINNSNMREGEKAQALLQYVEASPEVRDAIIKSSYGEYRGTQTQPTADPYGQFQ